MKFRAPPDSLLPSVRLGNSHLPKHQQFAMWRDFLGGTHDAALLDGRQEIDGFRADAIAWNWGEVVVVDARTEAQQLQRSPRRIRADHIDHYAVRLHRAGQWFGEAGDRAVQAEAGDVMVLDLARPTTSRATMTDNFTVILPREVLDEILPPTCTGWSFAAG